MINYIGRNISNNISETGEYYFSNISETGTSQTIGAITGPLYSIAPTGSIAINGNIEIHEGYFVLDKQNGIVLDGASNISPVMVGPKCIVDGLCNVTIAGTKNSIFTHDKKYLIEALGKIVGSSKSKLGFIIPVDKDRKKRLQLAVIFTTNLSLLPTKDYNLKYIYNPSLVPNGIMLAGISFDYQEVIAKSGIVAGILNGKINTARFHKSVSGNIISGNSKIYNNVSYQAISNIVSYGHSLYSTSKAPQQILSKVILDGKTIINVTSNINGVSGILASSPSNMVSLGGTEGYCIKSNCGMILYNENVKINKVLNINTLSQIIIDSKSLQESFYKTNRALKLNEYPFINTNGLDDVAFYLGIHRLPGETDENFFNRIKRLAKIKYGINYETSVESINEQLGNSLEPILKIECNLPFTFELTEEYIEIKIFNSDGSRKSYTKIFTNIQNTTDNSGVTIYSPLVKLFERVPEDIKITILDKDYKDITRELIFKNSNFSINKSNIISQKRSFIKMEHKSGAILPGSIKDDGYLMINRVYDLQSVNTYGSYLLDENSSYLELFADTVQPFSLSFIEYKKTFIIYKANINIIPISNYIKYGISNNFINILYLLLDNKVISN